MTSHLKASLRLFLISLTMLLMTTNTGMGADCCLGSVTDLYTYLQEAQENYQEDTIKIQQGYYYESFSFGSGDAYSITISGDYTENCSDKSNDESKTILDAGKNARVLLKQTN